MLTKDQLRWTEKDTQIVEQHKLDVAAGKVKGIEFTKLPRMTEAQIEAIKQQKRRMSAGLEKCLDITFMTAKELMNAPSNFWFCGNCECYDQADGDRKACACPCHKPGGCNYE